MAVAERATDPKLGEGMKYHVYVSNSGSTFFSKFLMDSETGDLAQDSNIDIDAAAGAVAGNRDGSLMFAM